MDMKETDLYKPVKELFEKMGYTVNGEVKDMDVTAVRGDELVVVELKTAFNITLLQQAVKRQKITEQVYVAIPRPDYKKRFSQDFKDKEYLLRRLSLGLILVAMDSPVPYASIALEPKPYKERTSSKSQMKKEKALREIEERHGDHNIGGSNRVQIVTAYRECVLRIAGLMELSAPVTAKELKDAGCGPKTYYILKNNYYGWFRKDSEGKYRLTEKAYQEMERYRDLINLLIFDYLTKDDRMITLRKAKIGEAKLLSEIVKESVKNTEYPDEEAKAYEKKHSVSREYIRDSLVYIAEIGGELAGFWSLVERTEDLWEDEILKQKGFWLDRFFVKPKYRNMGVGKRMFQSIKAYGEENNIRRIFGLTDPHTEGFFDKMGVQLSETVGSDLKNSKLMEIII
jgi:GNAT superfamily N-acetyltransferase